MIPGGVVDDMGDVDDSSVIFAARYEDKQGRSPSSAHGEASSNALVEQGLPVARLRVDKRILKPLLFFVVRCDNIILARRRLRLVLTKTKASHLPACDLLHIFYLA